MSSRLFFVTLFQICSLTLLLSITLLLNLRYGGENIRTLAKTTARTSATESLEYRELFVMTGGAYLPVDGFTVVPGAGRQALYPGHSAPAARPGS
ncbi:MAG: hypothetical protein A2512_00130 [Deltaproteobacteria bacterium RIFOXYD12_FULL_56_24]|nr:MAG: hypothetical protein A2512_00130 [Deltaproteobacteria bacterium RIFOXYD12_FULL_56_24]